jgi:hypothetical protein
VSEHQEQVALFNWARMMESRHPQLKWLFAIPNGGLRNKGVAVKLKKEGVKAGVADVFLPISTTHQIDGPLMGMYHGLWIEMKYGANRTGPKQIEFLEDMDADGYATAVCYTWEEAKDVIVDYLGLEVRE